MSIYGIDSIKYQRPINRYHLRVWSYHRNRMATPRRPLTGSSVRCWYREQATLQCCQVKKKTALVTKIHPRNFIKVIQSLMAIHTKVAENVLQEI